MRVLEKYRQTKRELEVEEFTYCMTQGKTGS